MSSADLSVGIAVSTDVEQATKKTSSGLVSMEHQINSISKKFSSFGKDLFLGFFAPMAIFQTAMSFITDKLAEAKASAEAGRALMLGGDTRFSNVEQNKRTSYVSYVLKEKEDRKAVEDAKAKIYEEFLKSDQGAAILNAGQETIAYAMMRADAPLVMPASAGLVAQLPEIRAAIEEYFQNSPEYKKYTGLKDAPFKGPEGFSSIVGVGANPVMEAMTKQTDIQQDILDYLRQSAPLSGSTDLDFTKSNPALKSTV